MPLITEAQPENWQMLIDLRTFMAIFRALSVFFVKNLLGANCQ